MIKCPPGTQVETPYEVTSRDNWIEPEPCRVLSLVADHAHWVAYRGEWYSEQLNKQGIPASWIVLRHSEYPERIAAHARKCGAEIILSNVGVLSPDAIEHLAKAVPDVKIVPYNHAGLSAAFTPCSNFFKYLEVCRKYKNVFYACVDTRIPLEHERMLHLPNMVRDLKTSGNRQIIKGPGDYYVVGLSVRNDVVKNIATQIAAVALAAKDVDIAVALQIENNKLLPEVNYYLQRKNIIYRKVGWKAWKDFPDYLDNNVDVGLQTSLSESYNLVALETMSLGIPVAGSPTIRYLPASWQVDPEDPKAIANVITSHLGNLDKESTKAETLGHKEAKKLNKASLKAITKLLSE